MSVNMCMMCMNVTVVQTAAAQSYVVVLVSVFFRVGFPLLFTLAD